MDDWGIRLDYADELTADGALFSDPWSQQAIIRSLFESAPIAITMVDETGRIAYVNDRLEELFGYTREELLQEPIEVLMPERFHRDHVFHRAGYVVNPHFRAMGSGMELMGCRKDGTEFPIEVGLSYVRVRNEMLVFASVMDITRRKQTEELLERRVAERTLELERRQRVADSLRDILAILNSSRSIAEILDYIVAQACRLLHADASIIYTAVEDDQRPGLQASASFPPGILVQGPVAPPAAAAPNADAAGFLAVDGDVTYLTNSTRITDTQLLDRGYQAMLSVPLIIKSEVHGNLMLYYRSPRKFSHEEIELAMTVGDQTALAIENARLRTQVERAAVVEERNRIARDLHDSVTQTLFSASLIAEVLPRLWQRNDDEARRRLEELRQLTRGALAEMRTLLLELRPATLIEVDLNELLRQLVEAISGRSRVPVELTLDGDGPIPPDIKVALYHIAQEALNNVAKHARATRAKVTLQRRADRVELMVEDNGRGFVLETVTPEHLGLTIMQERAGAIDAVLAVRSKLDQGTSVSVVWSR